MENRKLKTMKIERFEDLDVWKEARELCKFIKEVTNTENF